MNIFTEVLCLAATNSRPSDPNPNPNPNPKTGISAGMLCLVSLCELVESAGVDAVLGNTLLYLVGRFGPLGMLWLGIGIDINISRCYPVDTAKNVSLSKQLLFGDKKASDQAPIRHQYVLLDNCADIAVLLDTIEKTPGSGRDQTQIRYTAVSDVVRVPHSNNSSSSIIAAASSYYFYIRAYSSSGGSGVWSRTRVGYNKARNSRGMLLLLQLELSISYTYQVVLPSITAGASAILKGPPIFFWRCQN